MADEKTQQPNKYKMIDDMIEIAEKFGIEKRDIGKTIMSSLVKGKFDLKALGMPEKEKKSGFQKTLEALRDAGIPVAGAGFLLWLLYRYVTHVLIP